MSPFRGVFSGALNPAAGEQQNMGPSRSALEAFGLPASPLALGPMPLRKMRAMEPAKPPSTLEREPESSPNDIAAGIRSLTDVAQQASRGPDPLAKIEAAIRRLPQLPAGIREERLPDGTIMNLAPTTKMQRRAMTPLEGPDTGEINPNADPMLDPSFYAALRGPEGTTSNYDAVNPTTGASGPYQFLRSTWEDLMHSNPDLGLTLAGFNNPSKNQEQHERAIRAYTKRSLEKLQPYLGRTPTPGELYAAHIFGQQGGLNFLKAPDAHVADIIPDSWIAANPWMRSYAKKPGRELLKRFEDMMTGSK